MPLEDFIIRIYCLIDDTLKNFMRTKKLRQRGFEPHLSDSEWLVSTRRLVETVISQLTERFHIEKIRARKLWYLTNRIARKVLAHTIAIFINKQLGHPPLQFELLLAGSKS